MKLLLLLAFIVTSATIARAQIIKSGDLILGGTLGLNSGGSNGGYSTSSNTNIAPRIGVGIGRNSIIGAKTSFSYGRNKIDDIYGSNSTTKYAGLNAFWQKFFPIKGQLGWTLEANAGVGFNRSKNTNNMGTSKGRGTTYGAAVVPGFYYQPLPKLIVSVDFGGLTYQHYKQRDEYNNLDGSTNISNSRGSNASLSLLSSFNFGIDFVLGKKS